MVRGEMLRHTFIRTLPAVASLFAIVLVAGCDSGPAADAPAPGTSPIVGTWILFKATVHATGATPAVSGRFVFEADGTYLTEVVANGDQITDSGTYAVDDKARLILLTRTMRNGQAVDDSGSTRIDYVVDGNTADFIDPPGRGSGVTYHGRRG